MCKKAKLMRCLYLICLFCANYGFAQIKDSATITLPAEWIGEWAGTLEIINSQGKQDKVAMKLLISKHDSMDRWNWAIVYGTGDTRQERKYQLIAKNSTKGWYQIDEKNGIYLDAFYAQNTLTNVFEVENNLLMTVERLEGKKLYFEVVMVVTKAPNLSGGNAQGIPAVKSYPVRVFQRSVLTKRKKRKSA